MSDLMVRHPILTLMGLVFAKLKMKIMQLKENNSKTIFSQKKDIFALVHLVQNLVVIKSKFMIHSSKISSSRILLFKSYISDTNQV